MSQFISTIQERTLGYVINVQELTFAANQINNQLLTRPFQVLFILAITYFVVCFTLTRLTHWLEQRIRRGGAAPTSSRTASGGSAGPGARFCLAGAGQGGAIRRL